MMNKSIQDDGANGSIQFIDVVAAVIRDDQNRFLIAKRKASQSNGGLWEFPGGKVEQGETEKEALAREIHEELGIEIEVQNFIVSKLQQYENVEIHLHSYFCNILNGTPAALEHEQICYVDVAEFSNFEFTIANLATIECLKAQNDLVPETLRTALLNQVCATLMRLKADPVLRVAIDGVDGAGKTTFADELGTALLARGCRVIRASVDGFHNPRAARYQKGRDSPEGFFEDSYDYPKFIKHLLRPLSPGGNLQFKRASFDCRTDSVLDLQEEQALVGSILIIDGIFLHRNELRQFWDFSIFLATAFEHSYARMSVRDGCPPEPANQQNRRYFEGQKIYLASCTPEIHASMVINNDNLYAPIIVKK